MGRLLRRAVVLCACAFALIPAAAAHAVASEAQPPPGANDFACAPSAAHPNPVVLVHGLGATMGENWGYVSPRLKAAGYCVYALTYGLNPVVPYFFGGTIRMEDSAPELGAFVDRVLAATHAAKVDLVGHSEGTVMPQYWLKRLGGAAKVDKYVALTPLYDGTTLYGVSELVNGLDAMTPPSLALLGNQLAAVFCGSCREFLRGSPFLTALYADGKAAPGVTYTTIMSRHDELVIPYTSGVMPGATNIVVQDQCPNDLSEHVAVAFDRVAVQDILNALDPARAKPVTC